MAAGKPGSHFLQWPLMVAAEIHVGGRRVGMPSSVMTCIVSEPVARPQVVELVELLVRASVSFSSWRASRFFLAGLLESLAVLAGTVDLVAARVATVTLTQR